MFRLAVASFVVSLQLAASPGAQQLLDRVVAHVSGVAITLTDVRAAVALGVVDAPDGPDGLGPAVEQLIERQLILLEVERFVPPEPPAEAVRAEVARLTAQAGASLAPLQVETGLDEARIREIARDTLRIRAYIDQRFGNLQVGDEEAERYYREHAADFTRNGILMAFEEAAPEARRLASADRRNAAVDRWVNDLRGRAEIQRRVR